MAEAPDIVLDVEGLRVRFAAPSGKVAVDGIDLRVEAGRTTALVGQSGSGKTVTALSIMRLIPRRVGRVTAQRMSFTSAPGEWPIDLGKLSELQMRSVRGRGIAMIFQDPAGTLNPVLRIGDHVMEAIRLHKQVSRREAADEAASLLERVGLCGGRRQFRAYPHQLSGGMQQRVSIAMALACSPRLLIADEPTSALDVMAQVQILDLLVSLQRTTGMAILLITHDFGVVARLADEAYVMRGGLILERASVDRLFVQPQHPYTRHLLAAARSTSLDGRPLA